MTYVVCTVLIVVCIVVAGIIETVSPRTVLQNKLNEYMKDEYE